MPTDTTQNAANSGKYAELVMKLMKPFTHDDKRPWLAPSNGGILLGLIFLCAFGISLHSLYDLAVAVFLAFACSAVGAIAGFVFAIPRSIQGANDSQSASQKGGTAPKYTANTNLEQISDWVTKIFVGLGLTEIGTIPSKLTSLAEYSAKAFNAPTVQPSLVSAMQIYFAILGFMTTYLWTRIYLIQEFSRAESEALESPEFTEGLTEALLYQPGPEGFTKAMDTARQYLQQEGDGNWRIWRALACAYGQKYSFLKNTPNSKQSDLDDARNNALDAIKHVLTLNPAEKAGLTRLWDPSMATPQENDLVVFYGQKEFEELLSP